jgi:hypothetical protein
MPELIGKKSLKKGLLIGVTTETKAKASMFLGGVQKGARQSVGIGISNVIVGPKLSVARISSEPKRRLRILFGEWNRERGEQTKIPLVGKVGREDANLAPIYVHQMDLE